MRGILMRNDEELRFLIGKVKGTEDEGDKYCVEAEYDIRDYAEKTVNRTRSTIVFRNEPPDGFGTGPRNWADWARRKNLAPGDTVGCVVRIANGLDEINGYNLYFSGERQFGRDSFGRKMHAVGGTVTWMKDAVESGKRLLLVGIYTGRDAAGNPCSTIVRVNDPALIRKCVETLEPRAADGTKTFSQAWFKCGDAYRYFDTRHGGVQRTMYYASDFVKYGSYKKAV